MKNLINSTQKDYLENINPNDVKIKDFRKLKAYELGLEFYAESLEVIKKYPDYEQKNLADQLRRSASKIALQIAEGNSGLHIKRECYFLTISLGSLGESQANLDVALVSQFISQEEHKRLNDIAEEIKRLLVTYIRAMLQEVNGEK